MLPVRLPVNSRLLVVNFFGESKIIRRFSTAQGVDAPNPIVQESTIIPLTGKQFYIPIKKKLN